MLTSPATVLVPHDDFNNPIARNRCMAPSHVLKSLELMRPPLRQPDRRVEAYDGWTLPYLHLPPDRRPEAYGGWTLPYLHLPRVKARLRHCTVSQTSILLP